MSQDFYSLPEGYDKKIGFDPEALSPPLSISYSWKEAWRIALTSPKTRTYQSLINAPDATAKKAYLWVFIVHVIVFGIAFIVFPLLDKYYWNPDAEPSGGGIWTILVIVALIPILSAMQVVIKAVEVKITDIIAGLLGGQKSYSKLLYLQSAYLSGYMVLSSILLVLLLIPCINALAMMAFMLLSLYMIACDFIAIKAVYGFEFGKVLLASPIFRRIVLGTLFYGALFIVYVILYFALGM